MLCPHPGARPALDRLQVRLTRDAYLLRDAIAACPEGLVPEAIARKLLARATTFGRLAPMPAPRGTEVRA